MEFGKYYCFRSHTFSLQGGSALVESILIVGVLTIFMTGVPMIGSMIDLKQTTIQASRYSAWEKTISVKSGAGAAQIEQRFFRDASAPITTELRSNLTPNTLWGDLKQSGGDPSAAAIEGAAPIRNSEAALFQKARVTLAKGSVGSTHEYRGGVVSTRNLANNGDGDVYRGVAKVVTALGSFISPDGWNEGKPFGDGLVKSSVEASIQNNTFFDSTKTIKEFTSIFIDGWSENDDSAIRERVHGFVPTNRLQSIEKYISIFKNIPFFTDLRNLETAFGCVKNNIIPAKELSANAELTVYDESPGDQC